MARQAVRPGRLAAVATVAALALLASTATCDPGVGTAAVDADGEILFAEASSADDLVAAGGGGLAVDDLRTTAAQPSAGRHAAVGDDSAATPDVLAAATEAVSRSRTARDAARAQAQALYEKAEALRHTRADALAATSGGADVSTLPLPDAHEIVRLYAAAAALQAGPPSGAAAAVLARMSEWGWDGRGDLVHYTGGGGGGAPVAGSSVAGWWARAVDAGFTGTSAGRWLAGAAPSVVAALRGGVSLHGLGLGWLHRALTAPLGSSDTASSGAVDADDDAVTTGGVVDEATWPPPAPQGSRSGGSQLVVPADMAAAVHWWNVSAKMVRNTARLRK